MTRPRLIVVTGRPGAGKTTLAHALAQEIGCPAVCRDEIKEGYVRTTGERGTGGDAIAGHVYETFTATLRTLLEREVSVVAEAAFQDRLWRPLVEDLWPLADVRVILCEVDVAIARARMLERHEADPRRRAAHHDDSIGIELVERYQPPSLGVRMLVVDTSDGYQPALPEIVAFAIASNASPTP